MKKLFSLFAAVLFAGSMMAAEVEVAKATFDGKNATYTTGWTTNGTGVSRTDCVIIGKDENITSPTINISAYNSISITFKARRYGSLSGSKATISVAYGSVELGTIDVTASSVGNVSGSIDYTVPAGLAASAFVFTCTNATSAGSSHGAGIGEITITGNTGDDAVAAPRILGEESFKGSTSVNITCDTQGATIYYTLDGTDPTAESTEFTAAITLTETKTVKAIAIKGEDASEVASKTFTKLEPMTCAEVYSKAKNAAIYLNAVTVTYANGKNVYVMDATGAMLLYLPSADAAEWAAGDVLSGVEGTLDIYNGLYEVKPSDAQVAAVTATAGTAPEPIEFTAAPVADDMNTYIIMNNVSVAEGEFTTASATNLDLTIGDATVVLRNNFKLAQTFEADKTYNVKGVCAVYNSTVQVYFISAEEYVEPVVPADRRINAWGLNSVANGDDYVFSYYANIAGEEANLLFYKDGVLKGRVAVDAPKQGVNDVTLAKSEIPQGTGLTWAVKLKANPVTEFAKLAEGSNLMKCHLAIDNSPESDYFGRMYVANRAGSASGGIYIYNQDFTVKTSNTLAGQSKWQSMGRPSVADDGTVYIGDWGDSHGGVYVMNPATETATCLFDGTQDASTGLWTNAVGVAMGSSTASVGVYGSGENTVLYAMNEDASTAGTTLYAHGANVYQLGQADGSVLSTWNVAPTKTFAVLDNAAQMFVINPTSKGAFFSCSRAKPNNASGARSLQFYNTNGQRTYVALPEGATADLTGSLGGGCAVSRDEKTLAIVDGDGNILVYNIAWNVDTPSLTLATKYTTEFAALGSLCFDYAGNIVVTAGANYNNSTANKLVAYGVPTDNNEIIVPAKKSLTVIGTDPNPTTAIDNIYVLEVQKVIRNGQVLIIKDGKTYNMMGQIVE